MYVCVLVIWLRVWSESFTFCFTFECCHSQSSTNLLQHHIAVSFYCLIGDIILIILCPKIIIIFTFGWIGWYAVSPSILWVWLCSWQEVWGPTHDSLSPAGQFPGHMRLHQAKERKNKILFSFFKIYFYVFCIRQLFDRILLCVIWSPHRQKPRKGNVCLNEQENWVSLKN